MSLAKRVEAKVRERNRPRMNELDRDQLRDVVAWLNAYDPYLLEDILNDLAEEWDQ